ncbi:hypothetical protein L1987_18204 [Smallanthus sonchifolius]|uniref:Uncharacterized protein n=1 Tax=Smallanthus sonchifolius TaxID=185202 RepID=A0ACB9IZM2_9ASTR|nr:hypothetical protein L1987_18204 [Smallanthus sonchifolius]
MDDTVSVTTSCLAVADTRPRRTGGCVGIFFQLFDWNRRFSKKKLFCKRLLAPDRAKEASKKFGGDEKLQNLRLIADENIGSFENKNNNGVSSGDNLAGKNGVQTPSLVARLMGLESMPSVQRDKLVKDTSGEFRGGRRQKLVGEDDELDKKLEKQDFRPQKLQKTGMVDRRSVTRFGAEALQLKNVLSRSRKHHHPKLASPVQNSGHQAKRNSSRLIGAATRVLESGLQARNKSKYTITSSARNRVKGENLESLSPQASCKNCGSLIDVSESKSKINVHPSVLSSSFVQEHKSQPQSFAFPKENNRRPDDVRVSFQSKFSSLPFNGETKDFVALNRSLTGQTRPRVLGKFENGPSQWQKRRLTRNGPRMVSNAQSAGKQIGSEAWKPNYQGQIGNKNCDGMAFRFNSPTRLERIKNNQNATSLRKCSSKLSEEKIGLQKPFPLTGGTLGTLVEEKLQALTGRVGYDSRKNGNPSKRAPATIFQDLLCSLSMDRRIARNNMEFRPKRNHLSRHSRCRYDYNTRFCLQTKLQTARSIGHRNSDHLSPASVLETSFSNESCCSSSLEDSSVQTQHAYSTTYSNEGSQFQDSQTNPFYSGVLFRKESTHNKLVVDLLTYISQVLSTIDIVHSRITGHIRAHVKHVVFNSELALSNQMPRNPNELNSFFICDLLLELDNLAEVIQTTFGNFLGSQNSGAGYQLKRFVFDVVIDYLESKYARYSKCGFRAWIELPPFMGFDVLIREVVEEVRRLMGLVGEADEGDMSHCLGKWTDFDVEVYETGAKIEWDILQMLVDEIVVDI